MVSIPLNILLINSTNLRAWPGRVGLDGGKGGSAMRYVDDFLDKYQLRIDRDGMTLCVFAEKSVYLRSYPAAVPVQFLNGTSVAAKVFLFDERGECESCAFDYHDLKQDIYGRNLVEQTVH